MKINIYQLIEGAKKAKGLAVVIDVFRAFSVACYVTDNNADKIIPVGAINLAYSLKEENPDYILMGERDGQIQEGFDYGNSPSFIKDVDFSGKTVVHTTSAGTQGIANALDADEIITASFVNVTAVINYIRNKSPEEVSLLCMGEAGIAEAQEDTYCAEYIKAALEGRDYMDMAEIKSRLKVGNGKKFFLEKNHSKMPQNDFDLCLDIDKFNFVLKSEKINNEISTLNKK